MRAGNTIEIEKRTIERTSERAKYEFFFMRKISFDPIEAERETKSVQWNSIVEFFFLFVVRSLILIDFTLFFFYLHQTLMREVDREYIRIVRIDNRPRKLFSQKSRSVLNLGSTFRSKVRVGCNRLGDSADDDGGGGTVKPFVRPKRRVRG